MLAERFKLNRGIKKRFDYLLKAMPFFIIPETIHWHSHDVLVYLVLFITFYDWFSSKRRTGSSLEGFSEVTSEKAQGNIWLLSLLTCRQKGYKCSQIISSHLMTAKGKYLSSYLYNLSSCLRTRMNQWWFMRFVCICS